MAASRLAKEPILHPSDKFYIGQSLRCRVISCDADRDRLALTFILDGEPSDTRHGTAMKRSASDSASLPAAEKRAKLSSGTAMTIGEVILAISNLPHDPSLLHLTMSPFYTSPCLPSIPHHVSLLHLTISPSIIAVLSIAGCAGLVYSISNIQKF